LLAGATCIGFAPLWVRWSEVGPAATAFHRLILALPFLGLWAARERSQPRSRSDPTVLVWTVAAGVLFAFDLAAWHLSIRLTTVANATLLGNFAPIFVTLGAWVFLGELAGRRFFAGMLFAFLGAWWLTGASPAADPRRLRGAGQRRATAVFYGGYQLCVARLRRSQRSGRILLGSSLVSAPLLWLIAWVSHEKIMPATGQGWLVLLGLALTAQILGQGLITYGFAHLPAGYSSLTLLLQPVVAALAGWALLGERLGLREIAGAAVLLAGLALARPVLRSSPPFREPQSSLWRRSSASLRPMQHSPGFLKAVDAVRPHVREVTVEQARARLAANPKAILLDVREDREWQAAHAVEARHLGRGVLERDLEALFPDPGTEIIMYCGGGFRSALACDAAQRMGYRNVFSLAGGFRAMTAAAWPTQPGALS